MSNTIYGRPAFAYNTGSGNITLQLPLCEYSIEIRELAKKIYNPSADMQDSETHYLGRYWSLKLQCSKIQEADRAALYAFEQHANKGGRFTFAQHYPTNSRPVFPQTLAGGLPMEYLYNCEVTPDSQIELNRSEQVAGLWDFAIAFIGRE